MNFFIGFRPFKEKWTNHKDLTGLLNRKNIILVVEIIVYVCVV